MIEQSANAPARPAWMRAIKASAFGALYGLAAMITLAAGFRVLVGADFARDAGNATITVLALNLALILGLGGYIGLRLRGLAKGVGRDQPAPRLHMRFVAFLGVAALVPSLLIAAFLGIGFVQVLDTWFSKRVGAGVENVAEIANAYLKAESQIATRQIGLIATDLNKPDTVAALAETPIQYALYLQEQLGVRDFDNAAAYVVDRNGAVLAKASRGRPDVYAVPPTSAFDEADKGRAALDVDRNAGRFRILFKLRGYEAAYLHMAWEPRGAIMPELAKAEAAVVSYREAAGGRERLKVVFGLIYLETALLILIGAIWFGLTAANRFVTPIGRLVRAAQRVRDGDLSARVHLVERRDELATLGRAFNEMTDQLRTQRAELVQAGAMAERRRQFTEAVLAGVSAGVVGVDAAGRITHVNESALALLDIDQVDEIYGREAAVALPEFAAHVRQARSHHDVVEGHVDVERGGRIRNFNVRAAGSREGAVVVTFDDITRLVSAQRNAAWADVARRIAHEIKNPLTPIQLSAERLRRKYRGEIVSDPEVFERCTDTIVRQVSDIGRMVDEFSSFARMPEPRLVSSALNEVVRSAVFAQRVAAPEITFEADIPEAPLAAFCDERLIAQALANVLKNAAESVAAHREEDPGGRVGGGRIETRLVQADGEIVIEVSDDGVGWPAAQRERLTEPYMTTRERGTGLGLAIVRRVMEDHRGRLELADRPDGARGAVVRLVLPVEITDSGQLRAPRAAGER